MKMTDDIARKRAKLDRCCTGHIERDVALDELAETLHERFQKECELDDLKEAVEPHHSAVGLRPPRNKTQSSSLGKLAVLLSDAYENQKVVADLEDAVTLGCTASELRSPGHLDSGLSHHNPRNCRARFRKQADMRDLNEAIELHRAALELRPTGHPRRFSSLQNLALCLLDRYDNLVSDLKEAAMLNNASRTPCPAGLPDRDTFLRNLARDLTTRFEKPTDIRGLEEAIELHRAALELRPSRHPRWFSSFQKLSRCLLARYGNTGTVADLKEVVTLGRAALGFYPPGHPDYGTFLHNLACTLRTRFKEQTDFRDLQDAIEFHRLALEIRPSGHTDRSSSLLNLAVCLSDRYGSTGLVADLAEAVTLGHAALELRPPGHPNRDISLHSLACTLRMRFEKQDTMEDLEEAIVLHRAALELRPSGHPLRFLSLQNLALCLSDRYDNLRAAVDNPKATVSDRAARTLHLPEHSDRGTADLDEAIALDQEVLRLLTPGDCRYDISWQRLTARFEMKARLSVATPSSDLESGSDDNANGHCEDDHDTPLKRSCDVRAWLAANRVPNTCGGDNEPDNEFDDTASEQTVHSATSTAEISIYESDIVVAVMGPTGAGKSTFIDRAVGWPDINAGHDLTSCTKEVRAVRYPHTDGVRHIVLVDTPGFDDTFMTDVQVLQRIADWLKWTYEKNVKLSGILYVHRISDNRVGGTPLRNYKMFKELCGKDNFKNVILVTTMWDIVTEDVGSTREQELRADFWRAMIALGSTTRRFEGTTESASKIINSLPVRPLASLSPLQIQWEMVDEHIPLLWTSAGKTVLDSLSDLMSSFKGIFTRFNIGTSGPASQLRVLGQVTSTLRASLSTAESVRVHYLKGAIPPSLSLALFIETTAGTHHALFQVVRAATLLINVVIDYAREAKLSADVKIAINAFAKEMNSVQRIIQSVARRKPEMRHILEPMDARIISACANSMRLVCDVLRSIPSAEYRLRSVDDGLGALKRALEINNCTCGTSREPM